MPEGLPPDLPRAMEQGLLLDRLGIFREEIGIADVSSRGPKPPRRAGSNIGIWQRIITAEKNARLQYYAIAR